jgi:serine/threonine-protein kinase
VKILDFGLAKSAAADMTADISASPTLTAQTGLGVILGTAAYMSPEQARGRPVDARTDIWAFGAVLYECLTGRRVIAGETTTDAIVAILEREPDWSALPAATPAAIRTLLPRCLKKDVRQRLHHIADARFIVEEALAAFGSEGAGLGASVQSAIGGAGAVTAPPPRAMWRHPLPVALAIATALAVGAAGMLMSGLWVPSWLTRASSRPRTVRLAIDLPAGRVLRRLALAPDGSLLAYIGAEGEQSRIYIRSFNRPGDTSLAGTEGAAAVFFSPDSQWIAFFSGGRLRKVPVMGGEVTSIADVPYNTIDSVSTPSGTWTAGGTIVLSSASGLGLSTVPSNGGSLTGLTTPTMVEGDQYHFCPEVLTVSRNVLFTVSTAGDYDAVRVEAVPTSGGARKRVLRGGGCPKYSPSGHLLLAEGGRLVAAPFDPSALATAGESVSIVEGLGYQEKWPLFDLSSAGDLAYAEQVDPPTPDLLRIDRRGHAVRLATVVPGLRESLSFSPDGERLAAWMVHRERRMSVVIIDLRRSVLTHLPLDGSAHVPVWLPDGRRLVYSSDVDGPFNLFVRPADGSGTAERLTSGPVHEDPGSLSRDGRWLAYAVAAPKTAADIWSFDMSARKAAPVRQTPAHERNPSLSPDARWVAYVSNESGRQEVYVEAFPQGGSRVQLSADGGSDPVWCAATQEVFYLRGNTLMAVKVDTSSGFRAGLASRVFDAPYPEVSTTYGLPTYAVSPDGQFFYMVRHSGSPPALKRIHVVLNWLDEFKQRMKK